MKKLCRKCGKAFRGMGAVCNCIMQVLDTDRKGQIGIFQVERAESEWQEFCSAIDEVLNVTTVDLIPQETFRQWMKDRCKSRKTKEDWTSLVVMYRDFHRWQSLIYTPEEFETAIKESGYPVFRGMVYRLVLKEDYDSLQVRTPTPRTQVAATGVVAKRQRTPGLISG